MLGLFSGRSGWDSAGLEVAGGVQGEFAEEFAGVAVDDLDVHVDEQGDRGAGAESAEADVVDAGVVPRGDGPGLVDLVVPDSAVRVDVGPGGGGLGSGGVGLPGGSAREGTVRADVVVVAAELGELALQAGGGLGGWLGGEPFLLGLVESLDLSAGLGMVRSGVVEPDPEPTELDLEGDPASAAGETGEDRTP